MGNIQTSPTFNFFTDNFDDKQRFILDFQDKRILFCYKNEDVTDTSTKISMEVLDRPHKKSSVTLRSLGNCQCKSDAKSYEPSATFKIYRDRDGLHQQRLLDTSDEMKILLKDLERAIIKYE